MDEAEFFLRRLIDIRELALGKDHPEVDSALNKLVQMCLRKEKFKAAELLFKRILESNERTLGKNHPHLVYTLNMLGMVSIRKNKPREAERFFRRVIAIHELTKGEYTIQASPTLSIGWSMHNWHKRGIKKPS